MQEKEKDLESRIIPPSRGSGEQSLIQTMSQVNLKELDIVLLRNQNKKIQKFSFEERKRNKIMGS